MLLVRVRKQGFELPKGQLEPQETKETATLRELREETGLTSSVDIGPEFGVVEYSLDRDAVPASKKVRYFAAFAPAGEIVQFGKLPSRTRELRRVTPGELVVLPPIIEELRSIIARALQMAVEG